MRSAYIFKIGFLACILCSCDEKKTTTIIDSVDTFTVIHQGAYPKKDSIFSYDVTVQASSFNNLTIKTKLVYDSLFLTEDYFRAGNKSVLSQTLFFNYNGTTLEIPVKSENTGSRKINGVEYSLPKYVITEVSLRKNKDNILYCLYEWGLSNGSKEITKYYSANGNLISSIICGGFTCDTIGKFAEINKKFDLLGTVRSVQIFPPQDAGKFE